MNPSFVYIFLNLKLHVLISGVILQFQNLEKNAHSSFLEHLSKVLTLISWIFQSKQCSVTESTFYGQPGKMGLWLTSGLLDKPSSSPVLSPGPMGQSASYHVPVPSLLCFPPPDPEMSLFFQKENCASF